MNTDDFGHGETLRLGESAMRPIISRWTRRAAFLVLGAQEYAASSRDA